MSLIGFLVLAPVIGLFVWLGFKAADANERETYRDRYDQ